MARFTLPRDAVAAHRYAEIARRMGLVGTSEQALINSLCEKIAKISELAVSDACTGSNPRAIDPATMERLFNCVYYGTEVDF